MNNKQQHTLQQLSTLWEKNKTPSFENLSATIIQTHKIAQNGAYKAINQSMTLRNWFIGCYIVEYEQKGKDRAEYGVRLLERLEKKVKTKGLNVTLFKLSRNFYLTYPQVGAILTNTIHSEISGELVEPDKSATTSHQLPDKNERFHEAESRGDACINYAEARKRSDEIQQKSATTSHKFKTPAEILVSKLSFSHIREIMTQSDPMARFFYETECIKGTWSVKELRRQIATNLYFRSGISKNPEKLLAKILPETNTSTLNIRQPFALEFLGLDAKETVEESDLENALILHLQEFLLELGRGFCFEARQKRMIIDDEYYFADLVFYNRILHCNTIIEVKNDEFRHSDLSQLNAYVSYFRDNEMNPGDNPPIGILLCTRKGEKMVEYALAGMDNHLFVSTYMLTLPNTQQLEEFLIKETKDLSL